jgi:SAM-dependent methyltransferase
MSSPIVAEDPLTTRARTIWSGADFLPIARSFAPGAAEFIARRGLRKGEAVLDVACGTGNLAIPAALAGATVTGVDIAANLIAHARDEARAAGVEIRFETGDAESLAYEDDTFDATVTMFGAMFAFRPAKAAAELLRVTRPGGRIAMANWTPGGFIGQLLQAHVAVVPPPAGVPSALLWGDETVVRERFGPGASAISCTPRTIELCFPMPPQAVADLFASNYGPTVATLKAADAAGGAKLRAELVRLFTEHNRAGSGETAVVGDYLEVEARVA